MFKKIFAVLLSCCMLAVGMSISGYAADASAEDEIRTSDAQLASLYQYNMGSSQSGSITEAAEGNNYQFTLSESGRVALSFTGHMERVTFRLYDGNGNQLWYINGNRWDSSSELNSLNTYFDLTKGTYQFRVEKSYDCTGGYEFQMNFTSAQESFPEELGGSNNTLATSSIINTDTLYRGQIGLNDDGDFYQFTLPASGRAALNFTGHMEIVRVVLYDAGGNEVWDSGTSRWDSSSELNLISRNLELVKGTYRLKVEKYYDRTGNYEFRLDYTSAEESFTEEQGGANNSLATSSVINTDTTYKGQIADNDDKDFYQFTMQNAGAAELNFTANIQNLHVKLYDSAGNELWSSGNHYWDWTSEINTINEVFELSAGTHYLLMERTSGSTGNYTFSIVTEAGGNDSGNESGGDSGNTSLPFGDVSPGSWYYETVAEVYEKGLMTGKDSVTFAPVETLARAQFATVLYRIEGEPSIAFSQQFQDIQDNIWYTDPILWAGEAGVVTGYSNGCFGPGDKINREQMATMMFRYANTKGLDTSQRADFSSYPDAGSVSSFAQEAMSWCVANGIITGDNGRLNPQGETARAVCATIISRFYQAYNL